jgi:hypothetical protein
VEARQRVKLTGPNRPIELKIPSCMEIILRWRGTQSLLRPSPRTNQNLYSARKRMGWTTWWLWRGACTRSHPELGRENPQRPWYCVSRRGRVGRRQVFQPIRFHLGAGWSSPVARQAHNLKAAGSNPAPATTGPELLQKTNEHRAGHSEKSPSQSRVSRTPSAMLLLMVVGRCCKTEAMLRVASGRP